MSFDPRPFVEHYKAENAAELGRISERAASAVAEARRLAAAIIGADPGVRAVILFGSLAEGGLRRLDFDIDLALDGGDLYKALGVTEESPFRVDVVRVDLLPEHVRERIRERGVVLAASSGKGDSPLFPSFK